MFEFLSFEFWMAVGEITLLDLLLGGDNAVVIALACRHLPPAQRLKGIVWGTGAAIVLRVVLILFAMELLTLPYIKLAGGALLLWIGVRLMLPHSSDDHSAVDASDKLWVAVRTIVVADVIMSVDNVMAVAAAAQTAHTQHHNVLVVIGLLISVPIIVWGSQLVLRAMASLPMLVTLGAMLLGWIGGEMLAQEGVVHTAWQYVVQGLPVALHPIQTHGLSALGASMVLGVGWLLQRRSHIPRTAAQHPPVHRH